MMNTDAILDFIVEYHIWFIVGFAIIALAIIGFIANKMKWLPKKEKNKQNEVDADMLAFYDDNVQKDEIKIENENSTMSQNEELINGDNNQKSITEINEGSKQEFVPENNYESEQIEFTKQNNDYEQIGTLEEDNTVNESLSNELNEKTKEEMISDFGFQKDDFENDDYNYDEEKISSIDEQEAREIDEEISESNVWIAHDEELNNEIESDDEINNISSEISDIDATSNNSLNVMDKLNDDVYNKPEIVPFYGESEMIKPVYEEDEELSVRPNIRGELEENNQEENTNEFVTSKLEEPKQEINEQKIEAETEEKEQKLPDISMPEIKAPSSLSFSTVDEDIDKLSKIRFDDENSIYDEAKKDNSLDDTMQISYSQLKAMVEDILAETDKEKIAEKTELPKDEKEDNEVEITEEKTEHQDDEDDVWKF